jgi:hypothetical protein
MGGRRRPRLSAPFATMRRFPVESTVCVLPCARTFSKSSAAMGAASASRSRVANAAVGLGHDGARGRSVRTRRWVWASCVSASKPCECLRLPAPVSKSSRRVTRPVRAEMVTSERKCPSKAPPPVRFGSHIVTRRSSRASERKIHHVIHVDNHHVRRDRHSTCATSSSQRVSARGPVNVPKVRWSTTFHGSGTIRATMPRNRRRSGRG